LHVRFVQGTAITIWTQGSYITGDFSDRIYNLEVEEKDAIALKKIFDKHEITYTEQDIHDERPIVQIIRKRKVIAEKKNGLPVMPLQELIKWCKKLYLENVLEQLDEMYRLNLRIAYAEIKTNT
jgi:hypothetical protein